MAEETDLIRVAFEGTDMFLRLAGAGAKEALKFLKFLVTIIPNSYRWWQETADRSLRKKLTKAEYETIKARKKVAEGSMDLNKFMKAFSAEERTILNIPDSSAKNFADQAAKNHLTYAVLPDLNSADGMYQIMVPNPQADIYKLIIERMINEELQRNEDRIKELEKELKQIEQDRASLNSEKKGMEAEGKQETEPERYQQLQEKIEELDLTKTQITEEIKKIEKQYSGVITYEDYMKTNPFAINHADMYAEMMDEGIEPQQITKLSDFLVCTRKNFSQGRMETFDRAVTDVAKLVDTGKEVVITDATHPENYIQALAYVKENENGEPFVCSEYTVYNNGLKQKCSEFSHGEFLHYSDGKSLNKTDVGDKHWINMKAEMQEKTEFGNQILVFDGMEAYEAFAKKNKAGIVKGTEYLVNPDVPGFAVRRDENGGASRYVLMEYGTETKIAFDIDKMTTGEQVQAYIRTIHNEIKKQKPDADLKQDWMLLKGETEYQNFAGIAKKNNVDKEELQEQCKQALGNEAEPVRKIMSEQEKPNMNILILPYEHMLVTEKERDNPNTYLLFSSDMNYEIKIPAEQVKVDKEGNRIVVLNEGESLKAVERNGNRIHLVQNQHDLDDFTQNRDVFAKQDRTYQKGGYQKQKPKNSFNDFPQRTYDYEAMEREFLAEQIKVNK